MNSTLAMTVLGCVFNNRPQGSTQRSEALHPSKEKLSYIKKLQKYGFVNHSFICGYSGFSNALQCDSKVSWWDLL